MSLSLYSEFKNIIYSKVEFDNKEILDSNLIINYLNLSSDNFFIVKSHRWNCILKKEFLNNPTDVSCVDCNVFFPELYSNLQNNKKYLSCKELQIKRLLE